MLSKVKSFNYHRSVNSKEAQSWRIPASIATLKRSMAMVPIMSLINMSYSQICNLMKLNKLIGRPSECMRIDSKVIKNLPREMAVKTSRASVTEWTAKSLKICLRQSTTKMQFKNLTLGRKEMLKLKIKRERTAVM